MRLHKLFATAALLGIVSVAGAQTTPRPQPLAPDFDVLTKKSIFSRDRTIRQRNPNINPRGGQRIQAPRNYTPIYIGSLLQDDGTVVAFIADPGTGQLSAFHNGDALPMSAGMIKDISLDDLTATAADKSNHKILIGQTILGGNPEYPAPAAPPPPAATATPAAPAPPGGGPDAGAGDNGPQDAGAQDMPSPPGASGPPGAGGPSGRLPGETMLDFLKRRRAQQIGTK